MIRNNSLTPEYYETIDNLALSEVYYNTAIYFYKKVCRWYSKNCSTPLMEVYNLPWDHVISAYYESMYESLPRDKIEELAKERFTPDLIQKEAEENEEFAKNFEQEWLKKVKGNKTESLDKPEPEQDGISLQFDDTEEP